MGEHRDGQRSGQRGEPFIPYTSAPAPLEWLDVRSAPRGFHVLTRHPAPQRSSTSTRSLLAAAMMASAASVAGGSVPKSSAPRGPAMAGRGERVIRGKVYKTRPSRSR